MQLPVRATHSPLSHCVPLLPDAVHMDAPILRLRPQAADAVEPFPDRREIADNKPGEALLLQFQVVNAAGRPVAGARVDVWHCDAQGHYAGATSASDGGGVTFLRGSQHTDDHGIAEFDTIVPGRHRDAGAQVHVRVWCGDGRVLSGRMILPEPLTTAIHDTFVTYVRHMAAEPATPDLTDMADRGAVARMEADGRRYVASLVIGPGA